ncbi:helix-turn-helix domain-containing protein [Lacticaseibacillus jixiensis]|jgi:transcriptional regulator with XRE-family HTH domain|uniref:helix-turn-helix domain-containing protein n=1 Tax=Lacticaseibacillus jixiensis TaxID=3231926 RepID=UPI0036F31D8F
MIEPVKAKLTLRQWRTVQDISVKRLAKDSGVSERTIYSYEHDINALRNARYEILESLADALSVSVNDIFLSPTSEKPKY